MTGRAVFTEAYAVLPAGTMRDITSSLLPHWRGTRLWVLARPMTGFVETFSQYSMEVLPNGGSTDPDPMREAQSALFVCDGQIEVTIDSTRYELGPGWFCYIPPHTHWTCRCIGNVTARFQWIRKRYHAVAGIDRPDPIVAYEGSLIPRPMDDAEGRWSTTRFVDPVDLRHDMNVNIVTFEPGGLIPFEETHVMEHGLYVLEGKAAYKLNRDWVEVEAGDFLWLRAFCPQACYAGGPGRFRYLLYKDVNRHASLTL